MLWLEETLRSVHPALSTLSGVPLWVFLIVAVLSISFFVGYFIKGAQVWWQLRIAIRGLEYLRREKRTPNPKDMAKYFPWAPMHRLWEEYADTLHIVRRATTTGGGALTEVRATVPAETFFTRDVLVDGRLFDDFTRHLPGVLTGLGIIGTFAGLLEGLTKFDPSSSATAVAGLGPLMTGVQHAFVASGFAITCAMLVVFFGKLELAYFYRLVDRVTAGIDSLYSTGAGEEYLARLVRASEQNEAHTAQLKDALVEDLTKLMTNLADRQIAAHESNSRAMSDRIGESLVNALTEPMKLMGAAMEQTARGNGEQVGSMLESLLTGFMAKLEDTFGGQMRGINEQMQSSMDAMSSVQSALTSLLGDIKATNEHAANQMSGKLEDAMTQATENQAVLTNQMREFVEEFRAIVADEQAKSTRAMDDAVMKVLSDVANAMHGLEATRKASATEEEGRNIRLASQTSQLVGGLSEQMESLLSLVAEQVVKAQQNIEQLGQVSTRAIDGMNQGALTMGAAAQRFETSGNSVTSVFDKSVRLSEQLMTVAGALQSATNAAQKGYEQYELTRRAVDGQVAVLMGVIENAKKDVGISTDLIANLRSSADALRKAESESRAHLENVNAALLKSFNEFGNALVSQVKATIAETDRHLSSGTGHLTGVVQELAGAVERMRKN